MDRRAAIGCLVVLGVGGWTPRVQSAGKDVKIAIIAHPNTGVRDLDAGDLEAIFTTRKREWPNGERIIAFNFPAKHPVRVTFDEAVLGMTPEEVARFWINRKVRGGNRPPRSVPSARLMGKVVAKLEGAIGYVPSADVPKGVRVVAKIEKGKVVDP